jgi:cobyrinic acid a,c-diamide synthase
VVLVVDAKGASLSLCATVKGFQSFRPDSNIRAVILNRCTAMQYAMLAPLLEKECSVRVAGYLPDIPGGAGKPPSGSCHRQEVQGLREKLTPWPI